MATKLIFQNKEHEETIAEQADLIVEQEKKLIAVQKAGVETARLLGIEKATNSELKYKVGCCLLCIFSFRATNARSSLVALPLCR